MIDAASQGVPRSVLLVLHVETHSGPQRSITPRLEYLKERGSRVTTLVPHQGPASDYAAQMGEVVWGMPGALLVPRKPAALVRAGAAMRRQAIRVEQVARAVSADLVIVSSARMPGALVGARRAQAATLLYAGECLTGPLPYRLMAEPLGRFAGAASDAIVVPSRAVGGWYAQRGLKPYLVHPPIGPLEDPDDVRRRGRELRKGLGLAEDAAVVCSLGAITRGRGQDVLIRALAEEADRDQPWHLVIGGEAYARPADRRFAEELRRLPRELGVEASVTFLDRVDDAAALYAASDVFVNPARVAESFGRAACEALTAGCGVVTTRVGGVIEALQPGKTALFVKPDDAGELGRAVTRIIEDQDLAADLASRGKRDVEARFLPPVENERFGEAAFAATATRRPALPTLSQNGGAQRGGPPLRSLAIMHLADVCGPSRSLESELRWLADQGSMEILVPGSGRLESDLASFARVRSLDYSALTVPRKLADWASVRRQFATHVGAFRRSIQEADPDVVIISSAVLPAAIVAAKLERTPSILYAGEILDKPRVQGRGRALAGRTVLRTSGSLATAIIACSDRVREQYETWDEKVTVINPPIGPRYASGDAEGFRAKHGLPAGEQLVLAVGALTHGRGQDILIRAMATVSAAHPQARLVIVGDPHPRAADRAYAQDLERMARTIAPDRVTFAGFEEHVEDAYAAASVVVNPARYESFGRVAFEAFAAGRPVVSTTAGGIPEVLRNGRDALLVSPDQPVALGRAISTLLERRGLAASLVQSGRYRLDSHLAPAASLERFREVVRVALEA